MDTSRACGIALGFLVDAALADPSRRHPVAGFGAVASRVEGLLDPPVDAGDAHGAVGAPDTTAARVAVRARGVVFTVVLVGGVTAAVRGLDSAVAARPALRVATTAATVWACLGGTSLLRIARRQAELLDRSDVDGSRRLLPWLCGREPGALDAGQLARAVVESVAENTSDAAVATLFWAGVAGPAGAAAHRAANTLDAMVGHRSPRYVDFGWASARLDDVLGWPAARFAGLLTAAVAPVVGGRPAEAIRIWRRDASSHPSPNAGVAEASCAGALGVRLGGPTPYPYGTEQRPRLGDGPAPSPVDIRRAVRLMRAVQIGAAAAAGCAAAAGARGHRSGARGSTD
ncbi:CobD/CbiB family cobalamin biosynthesis protein [Dietzia cinnamea]|uniref:CobD/CbiB family cobalamin biosynthesis protein n=1 Tax=Dietzia cinnamea TaxID=321318 RepID=UPI0021A49A29|nr:CobD/CbiB family cobalamin biosynthesis protein [Dietzia cinnamea]MCT2059969.1 cobalamin biosynthesis protein [Dietzia cinnamea]